MRTPERAPLVLILVAGLALWACQKPAANEEGGADTTAMGTTAAAPAEPAAGEGVELVVTNPMPHAMIVSVDVGAAEPQELGRVAADATETFTVPAGPGTSVRVTAHDEANTHQPSATITLKQGPNAWTIQ